jgi:hypothetical protein
MEHGYLFTTYYFIFPPGELKSEEGGSLSF